MRAEQRVLITGGAGGLGGALVEHYVREGANVVAVDRSEAAVHEGATLSLTLDLATTGGVRDLQETIQGTTQGLDLVVHAAGTFDVDPPAEDLEATAAVAAAMWRDNVLSGVLLAQAMRALLSGGMSPHLVLVGSADGEVASGGQGCEIGVSHDALYAASKAALHGLARALAMQWAPSGIRVNAIAPTIMRSPMADELLRVPGKEAQLARHIPLGRIAELTDVVTAVAALDVSTMTTGHVFPVDGGYLCR